MENWGVEGSQKIAIKEKDLKFRLNNFIMAFQDTELPEKVQILLIREAIRDYKGDTRFSNLSGVTSYINVYWEPYGITFSEPQIKNGLVKEHLELGDKSEGSTALLLGYHYKEPKKLEEELGVVIETDRRIA